MTGPTELALDVSAVPKRHPGGAGYYSHGAGARLLAAHDRRVDARGVFGGDEETAGARWAAGAAMHAVVPSSRAGASGPSSSIGLVVRSARLPLAPWQVHHGPHYTMPARSTGRPAPSPIHDLHLLRPSRMAPALEGGLLPPSSGGRRAPAGVLVCVSQVTADRLRECCEVRALVVVGATRRRPPALLAPVLAEGEDLGAAGLAGCAGPCAARGLRRHARAAEGGGSAGRRLRRGGRRRPGRRAGARGPDRLGDGRDRACARRSPPPGPDRPHLATSRT